MDVSVVIVNYNTRDLLLQCLASVFTCTQGVDFEVIVVDNCSSDGSVQAVLNSFNKVVVISSERNRGFGAANNLALCKARGKYLFFLNSDTILRNNALKYMFEFAEKCKPTGKIGALGALLRDINEKPTHSSGCFPTPLGLLKETLYSYWHSDVSKEVYSFAGQPYFKVQYIIGADLFICKSLYEHFQGFDENFFMYFEETDLQKRMYSEGYTSLIIEGPEIIHLEGASFGQKSKERVIVSNKRRMMYDRSKFLYVRKHYPFLVYAFFRIVYFVLRLICLLDSKYSMKERGEYLYLLLR